MQKTHFIFKSTLMLASALSVTGQAQAQEKSEGYGTELILVTARNRAENIQDVPLAITAITQDDIQKRGIENLEDVARFTAGFSFETLDGGNGAPVIRGLTGINSFNREQTTAIFIDNVYLPRTYVFDVGTLNQQRIEIVKGPQSSRFGRNAFAGAINYIPEKASLEGNSLDAFVTVGSDERFDIGGDVNFVAIEDQLAFYAAYASSEFDGTWENTHPFADFGFDPGTVGNAGGRDNQSYSAGVIIKPIERLTIDAYYLGSQIRQEALATDYRNLSVELGNFGPNNRLFRGFFPDPNETIIVEPRGFGRQVDLDLYRVELNAKITDAIEATYLFGQVEAGSLTAFQSEPDPINCGGVLAPFIFNDNSSLCNFQASPLGSLNYTSHEVRVTYDNDGPWRFTVGGFLIDGVDRNFFVSSSVPPLDPANIDNFAPLNLEGPNTGPPTTFPFDPGEFANFLVRSDVTNTDSIAAFFEIGVAINDGRTRFTFEGRYTSEEIETINLFTGVPVAPGATTFNFFTPRITLEHDFTDESLIYATVARGAKAGGFNSGAFDANAFGTYEPEFNWTYELGSKNTLFDNRLVLNAALFYTDWSNQQLTGSDPSAPIGGIAQGIILNFGNSRVYGFELESQYVITENLNADFSFAYINSQFTDGAFDRTAFVQGISGDIAGNDLPRSPDVQIGFGLQYDGTISDKIDYFVRADGSYQSTQFVETANNIRIRGRTLINTRVGFTYENYSLELWARNLFDKKFVSSANTIFQTPPNNNILGAIYGERRTWGATARVSF